jgi:hypothetical protein
METFSTKMEQVLNIQDTFPGDILLTPGRTDKKIIRGENLEENNEYRSHIGTLNWLCMGVRYDVVYTTKELSRVLNEPTATTNDIVRKALIYIKRTKEAHLKYSSTAMHVFQIPATRKKPSDTTDKYDTSTYNIQDGIPQEDDKEHTDKHRHKGPNMYVVCQTDIDLAGQVETRQSTSALMIRIMGALVHWRAYTERIVIQSTAAGEYIALSRGNTAAKFVRDILMFYGNGKPNYFLFTDNQAAEHIATTQPNVNDHSRSIDIRHHAIRQDYVNGEMRIGGVGTQDNTSDILTKNLQPPLHIKHTKELNILQNEKQVLTNCATKLTLNCERSGDDPDTSRNRHLFQNQQMSLRPSLKTDRTPILATHTDAHPHTCRQHPTTYRSKPPKERINIRHRGAKRHRKQHQPGTLEELSKSVEILRGGHDASHNRPKQKKGEINPKTHEMPPAFLDLIFP